MSVNATNEYHFHKLRRHFEPNIQFLARNRPPDLDKFELLGVVRERSVCANQATIDSDSDGKDLLGHVIVVFCFGAPLALVYLLHFCDLQKYFVGRAHSFETGGSRYWRLVMLTIQVTSIKSKKGTRNTHLLRSSSCISIWLST
jgi:hypothetical protein